MTGKAALLGLGARGTRWAGMFVHAGWRVAGFDPDPKATGLAQARHGWRREQTISATVADADWIMICLPDRLELMRKVVQRAQVQAAETAIIAVSSSLHDVEAVQGCAIRPSQVVLVTGDAGSQVNLTFTSRNPPDLKIAALSTLSQVCPVPAQEVLPGDQSADARSA